MMKHVAIATTEKAAIIIIVLLEVGIIVDEGVVSEELLFKSREIEYTAQTNINPRKRIN